MQIGGSIRPIIEDRTWIIIDGLRKKGGRTLKKPFHEVEVPAVTIVMVVIAVVVVAVLVVTVVMRVCSGRFEGHRDPGPASKFFKRSAVLPP
jgi:hypothetical protein